MAFLPCQLLWSRYCQTCFCFPLQISKTANVLYISWCKASLHVRKHFVSLGAYTFQLSTSKKKKWAFSSPFKKNLGASLGLGKHESYVHLLGEGKVSLTRQRTVVEISSGVNSHLRYHNGDFWQDSQDSLSRLDTSPALAASFFLSCLHWLNMGAIVDWVLLGEKLDVSQILFSF